MKIELDGYTKFLLSILVLCVVIAVYYKCVKTKGTATVQAAVYQIPPAPTAPAPYRPMGFINT